MYALIGTDGKFSTLPARTTDPLLQKKVGGKLERTSSATPTRFFAWSNDTSNINGNGVPNPLASKLSGAELFGPVVLGDAVEDRFHHWSPAPLTAAQWATIAVLVSQEIRP